MKDLFQFKEFDIASEGNNFKLFFKRILLLLGIFIVPMFIGILSIVFQKLPYAGYIVGIILLAYIPLYFKQGKPTVKVNDNFKFSYTAPKGVNRELMVKSLGSILVFCILLTFGFYALYDYF
jgi:hypothetical protein